MNCNNTPKCSEPCGDCPPERRPIPEGSEYGDKPKTHIMTTYRLLDEDEAKAAQCPPWHTLIAVQFIEADMQQAGAVPANQCAAEAHEIGDVTWQQAADAIEAMDDCARMTIGVDASGPRETLYRFLEHAKAALANVQPKETEDAEHTLLAILERAGEGATVADVLDRLSQPKGTEEAAEDLRIALAQRDIAIEGRDREAAKSKAMRAALDFAAGAIGDAIYTEDGLDGDAGQRVLHIITEARELGTYDQQRFGALDHLCPFDRAEKAEAALAAAQAPAPGDGLSFADAVRIASGCKDYGGGYRSTDHFEAYQHGIATVVRALSAAAEKGLQDTQVRALHAIGADSVQEAPCAAVQHGKEQP